MARIRTIKPQFFTSEIIAKLPINARVGFIGLWTHCDDEGRCLDNIRLIRAAVFPLDDLSEAAIEEMLATLAELRLIVRYEADNRRYIAVTNWKEHQRTNRPSDSDLPAPPAARGRPPKARKPHGSLSEAAVNGHGDLTAGIRNKEGNKEGKGNPPLTPQSTAVDPVDRVFLAWRLSANKPGALLSRERRRVIAAMLKNYPEADLIDAVRGWRNSPHHRGENSTGTVYNDLDLILRDAKHVEMFRDLWRGGESRPPPRLRNGERTVLANIAAGSRAGVIEATEKGST